jgi:hypothetical protein
MVAMKTCFPPLIIFLLFPHVMSIPAFFHGGMDWTRIKETKAAHSEVGVALEADGSMFAIYCLSNERQAVLRSRMQDDDPSVMFFGDCDELRNTSAARAASNASAKAKAAQKVASGAALFEEVDGKWRCLHPVHENCASLLGARSRIWHRQRYHTVSLSGAAAQ